MRTCQFLFKRKERVVAVQSKTKNSRKRKSNLDIEKPYLVRFARKLDNDLERRLSHGTLRTRVMRETTDDQ